MKTVEFILPEWASEYIVNGNLDGMSHVDYKELVLFLYETESAYGAGHWAYIKPVGYKGSNDLNTLGNNCDLYHYKY